MKELEQRSDEVITHFYNKTYLCETVSDSIGWMDVVVDGRVNDQDSLSLMDFKCRATSAELVILVPSANSPIVIDPTKWAEPATPIPIQDPTRTLSSISKDISTQQPHSHFITNRQLNIINTTIPHIRPLNTHSTPSTNPSPWLPRKSKSLPGARSPPHPSSSRTELLV